MVSRTTLPQSLQRRTILALNELGQAVTSSLKLDDVLLRVLVEVTALLGAEAVAILMPEGDDLAVVAMCGPEAVHYRGKRLPRDLGVAGYVMRAGEAVWVNCEASSVPGLTVQYLDETMPGLHSQSLLAAPLRQGGTTIGVLEAAHGESGALTPDDLPSLVAAANWAAIAISNAQLHEQAQRAREQQALLEERNRLARELHDVVTQSLYSMSTLAGAWRRQIDSGQLAPQKEHIVELGELAKQALREIRLLIYELRPTELEEEGLLGALNRRLEAVERRSKVQARLVLADKEGKAISASPLGRDATIDFYRMPPPVEHGLFRIVQEALNNALKHSEASSVCVSIFLGPSTLAIEVEDNGRGFDATQLGSGDGRSFGLSSMRERAEELRGRLSIRTAPGKGTTVRVDGVPYRFDEAEGLIA